MKIAVLDSGCDLTNKAINRYSEYIDLYVLDQCGWKPSKEDNTDGEFYHGSMVSRIILEHSEKTDFRLSVFQVFNQKPTSNVNTLISALVYINQNIDCDIIHMSLGVRAYNKELENICRTLHSKGKVIVAAFDNSGSISYPAAFDFVIGVAGSARCQLATDYVVLYNSVVDFKAKNGKQHLLTTSSGLRVIDDGNSLAAPYITAMINNLNPLTNDINYIKQKLEPNAKHVYNYQPTLEAIEYKIKKAAVFPFNKETQNLLNYSDELVFDIVDFYDIKYSGNLNKKHNSLFTNHSFSIKDYEKMDWSSFDTLIIGHLEELSVLCRRQLKKEILEKCLIEGKNAFCFDNYWISEYQDQFSQKGLFLICPCDCPPPNPKMGMLYQFATPILTIFGTSKKQGKFTLQLEIRKVLQQKGIKIGQIGTEPNSILFGMNQAIPLGYLGINYPDSEMIELINNEVHKVEKQGCDLIVLGSQSGFIAERYYNTSQIMMMQFPMLFAAPPDGVILAVNIQDSTALIKRTICSIESIGNTHVFLLALYAFDVTYDHIISSEKKLLSKEQIVEFRAKAKREFNLDVVVTGESDDLEKLYDSIINYFSKGE